MNESKKNTRTEWIDTDDAPELTDDFFEEADEYYGNTLIRRGRASAQKRAVKKRISVHLSADVIGRFCPTGSNGIHLKNYLSEHFHHARRPPRIRRSDPRRGLADHMAARAHSRALGCVAIVRGVSDSVGTYTDRLDACAARSEPRRSARFIATDCRRAEIVDEGSHYARPRGAWLIYRCPRNGRCARAGGVGGDSVSGQRCIGRYQRRLVMRRGDFVDWRLWRDSGRLGVEFQICVSGCDARRRADGLVRNRDGFCARGCVDHIGQFELVGHCVFSAARPFCRLGTESAVVELAALIADARRLFYFRDCRDGAASV